jgi:hypothetical protein
MKSSEESLSWFKKMKGYLLPTYAPKDTFAKDWLAAKYHCRGGTRAGGQFAARRAPTTADTTAKLGWAGLARLSSSSDMS